MKADKSAFARALRVCATLQEGARIHACIARAGLECDPAVATSLVKMYGQFGRPEDAQRAFDRLPFPDPVSQTTLAAAYARSGHAENAMRLFLSTPRRDVVSWTAMITALAKGGRCRQSSTLLGDFIADGGPVKPNLITLIAALGACARARALDCGKLAHAFWLMQPLPLQSDIPVATAAMKMYGKCLHTDAAKGVFDRMPRHDTVCRTAMLAVYTHNRQLEDASTLLDERDAVSCTTMIVAYAKNGELEKARVLFDKMLHRDTMSWNTMITAYARNGQVEDAQTLFNTMPCKDRVSWSAIIAAHAQTGHGEMALKLFDRMGEGGVAPDEVVLVGVLDACASMSGLGQGKTIHADVTCRGFEGNLVIGNAIINMYGKCGDMRSARATFERMPERDAVSWNAVITAHAENGQADVVLLLLQEMQLERVKPDQITFISILSACSRAGLVADARRCYATMYGGSCGLTPTVDHQLCMGDLLGRARMLDEAEELVYGLPFEAPLEAQVIAWRCVLGACKMHVDVERGVHAAEHLFELDPMNAGTYVSLSNIYATLGRWDDVARVSKLMRDQMV